MITKEQLACNLSRLLTDDETWDEQIRLICNVLDERAPFLPSCPHLLTELFEKGAM